MKGKELRVVSAVILTTVVFSLLGTAHLLLQGPQLYEGNGLGQITGAVPANVTVAVGGNDVAFSIDPTTIDFGALVKGVTNQTDAAGVTGPLPLRVINNGSSTLNYTINFSSSLFVDGDIAGTTEAFAFNCTSVSASCVNESFRNATAFSSEIVLNADVGSASTEDEFSVHFRLKPPTNESSGPKSVTITIEAVAS